VNRRFDAVVDGVVRDGEPPRVRARTDDLLRALVANIGLGPDGERAAKRLVDILIAGVRTQA
jgi:hypothetical protein